ncbi:unnamed protein product [Psylliodes chrysocephalus]|uniref:Uncharacterized protein n=1 Tax=Psylliodes chrysocephalus TaxID=3402493 RepID=A0A9P0GC85_9CUCU|nr:unnamed protein product [Psylliodes chrysocephala]
MKGITCIRAVEKNHEPLEETATTYLFLLQSISQPSELFLSKNDPVIVNINYGESINNHLSSEPTLNKHDAVLEIGSNNLSDFEDYQESESSYRPSDNDSSSPESDIEIKKDNTENNSEGKKVKRIRFRKGQANKEQWSRQKNQVLREKGQDFYHAESDLFCTQIPKYILVLYMNFQGKLEAITFCKVHKEKLNSTSLISKPSQRKSNSKSILEPNQPSCSYVSISELSPIPKPCQEKRKIKTKSRTTEGSKIITSSPYKDQLEEKLKDKLKTVKAKSVKKNFNKAGPSSCLVNVKEKETLREKKKGASAKASAAMSEEEKATICVYCHETYGDTCHDE